MPGTTPARPGVAPGAAYLLGWDPVANREVWRASGRGNGLLSTAGNLVFQGRTRSGLLGELVAFRADNGQRLWNYETPIKGLYICSASTPPGVGVHGMCGYFAATLALTQLRRKGAAFTAARG